MTNLNVNNISTQAQGIWSMRQGQDYYEENIQRQIISLEEKMKDLSTDKEKTAEQKKIEKQGI